MVLTSLKLTRKLSYLRVKADPIVTVTGVTLDKTTNSIAVEENATAVATVSPANATDKTVSWSSADNTIVTVDNNGKYTGVKAGKTDVIATAGGKTAKVTVTVA